MAKTDSGYERKHKVSRPDVHSKTRTSNNKSSKHYKKAYKGQGR